MPEKELWVYDDLTTVRTSAQGDAEGVGNLRWKDDYLYRWVQNTEVAAMTAGQACQYDSSDTVDMFKSVIDDATGVAADVFFFAGIAMGAIPASGYGYIMVRGYYATAQVDAPVTAAKSIGDILIPSASHDYLEEAVGAGTATTHMGYAMLVETIATVSTAATTTAKVLVQGLI